RQFYARAAERLKTAIGAPRWFWGRLWLAHAHRGLAMVAHEQGREVEADREFAEALAIIRDQVKANPRNVDPKFVLAWTQEMTGRRLASLPGRDADADAALAEAYALHDKLASDFPAETRYADARSLVLLTRANRQVAGGHDDRAEPDLVEAHRVWSGL